MSEPQPTGHHESANTADTEANLIDGKTGDDVADKGAADTVLTTDDDAQCEDSVARPGNT
ncbi:hypothetical protein SAMN05661080_03524 [Modestobacter sp. DSM 44400]|uniref:hypothetical protein n=1 Tax=Modestobacter sp. DSM 44400 TaxID=1550230 RepID=UPI00089AE469|nr:hypothetical protein [Modestobacter sp. DSM 44400]SDY45148.1 hypothetical protein SAMN05661080_03524 [Modestobacter sp. DSM 44400]